VQDEDNSNPTDDNPYLNSSAPNGNASQFLNSLRSHKEIVVVGFISILVLLGIGLSQNLDDDSGSTSLSGGYQRQDQVPIGFTEFDSDFSFKFASDDFEPNCDGCSYWTYLVHTQEGCYKGISASLNVTKGTTNSFVTSLYANENNPVPPRGGATLFFTFYPQDEDVGTFSGTIADINCR
jgi:hypothetical protein